MNRKLIGAVVAVTTLFAGSPMASGATTTAAQTADAWADFQRPAAWDNQADNLHWYVETPKITSPMVGKTATITVTSPSAIDCASLQVGYSTTKAWKSVAFTKVSCTGTEAVATLPATKAMVGQRPSLIGWTATPLATATITGQVRIGTSNTSQSVTAERHDVVTPVGPMKPLGTVEGKQVSIASAGGVNEIWVGSTMTLAPQGEVVRAFVTGGVVTVWTVNPNRAATWPNATTFDQWKLTVGTGAIATKALPMISLRQQYANGFLVHTPDSDVSMMGMFGYKAYDWDGNLVYGVNGRMDTYVGSTASAAVFTGNYSASLQIRDLDGSQWPVDARIQSDVAPQNVNVTTDAVRYELFSRATSTVLDHCTSTKKAVTCTGN